MYLFADTIMRSARHTAQSVSKPRANFAVLLASGHLRIQRTSSILSSQSQDRGRRRVDFLTFGPFFGILFHVLAGFTLRKPEKPLRASLLKLDESKAGLRKRINGHNELAPGLDSPFIDTLLCPCHHLEIPLIRRCPNNSSIRGNSLRGDVDPFAGNRSVVEERLERT